MNKNSVLKISLLAAFVAGCASNSIPDPDPSAETADTNAASDTYDSGDFGRGKSLADDPSAQCGHHRLRYRARGGRRRTPVRCSKSALLASARARSSISSSG